MLKALCVFNSLNVHPIQAVGVKHQPAPLHSGTHQDGFGGRTKRFQPSDYYDTVSTAITKGNPVPYLPHRDGGPMYHVAGNAG